VPARLDWVQLISKVVVVAILIGFAMWQAGSYRRAWVFISAIAATALVLNLAGSGVIRLLRQVRRLRSFPLRYGVGGLSRPGNQTKVVLFAVGIGTLFIVTVRIHQANVLAGYSLNMTALEADMFLIDVQPDQRAAVEATVPTFGGRQLKLIPLVRARLTAINRVVDRTTRESAAAAKSQIGGQFQVSYGSTLVDRETVVAGTLWPPTPSSEPEISIDENYARWIGLGIGDRLTFDVVGRRIDARITSIRQIQGGARAVAWRMRFDMLFRPGVLEQAPHMFVGALKGPTSPAERARLQNALVEALPNVTMIDAADDITEVRNRVAETTTIITAVGGFVSLCGIMILIGSIAITKVQRIYDAAVLKTLGAKRRVLMKIAAVEYSVLGLLAGVIGSGAAILVTRAQHAFDRLDFSWQLRPVINIVAVLLTVLLVTIVGIAASWEVLTRKPLGILREE
jgi:putative ABC transport system permease protein